MDFADIFIHDTTWAFLGEILVRCVMMFAMIILFLRLTGKRGIRQLSIFEVAIILSLGSVAGDPMFTEDLPLVQAFVVMACIITLYRLTTWLMMKNQAFEDLLEGKPLYIVKAGELVLEDVKKGKYSQDEFFAEMRQQNTEHLGQIRVALLESDGKLSILFYPNEEVKYGLPLFPEACSIVKHIEPDAHYACSYCGHVQNIQQARQACTRCECKTWAVAINTARLT
ncbi:DUF421 domain-containing protein [Acinetobacter lanii]|uniref:DUF421 domain-containing protein n=1 Tax=Acinetobacter lanii TaxID=2715163 RepID=A0A6G8S230_9GAMM|nr:YetF domain-containing protein [Acinetobacter lanii]QIO08262.1 DUF421 domain-containing protein [Acinetobacter lanii]